MHGGLKIYAGAPAAARRYVEADRGRADDYYLTEGTGVARRYAAGEGRVVELPPLTGETYQTWVAGRDPETGEPRGQLRTDAHAVRFAEVIVNGPKSWSLAAVLHPDIAAAYDAAQDRAVEQILGWLSQHATTRVGPRGGQVQVPVQMLEAAVVRHYTSRANDPHRHLHLQLNARVFAAGKWRGLHTVGVRDSLNAINGIGHAAMACDPQFRAALARHGYTVGASGEIRELADVVGPMSARHAQIARNANRYEREWTAAHPGEHPGPALRRAWDARAWAAGRPDKVRPRAGEDIGERWRTELQLLGHQAPDRPVNLTPTTVGALDREAAVARVLTRLASERSAWNPADVRGEVEQLIAAAGIVTEAEVRAELAEDLTARTLHCSVPLLQRRGLPEHIRAWTSRPVLDVEADLTARLAARAAEPAAGVHDRGRTPSLEPATSIGRLDAGQAAAVTALAGERPLVVVEGAAGAGKTTTLAAARRLLEHQGRRLVVATPTLKAAKVATIDVCAPAGSAAKLAFEYGWRWDDDGAWARLAVGNTDPVTGRTYTGPSVQARLRPGDLLIVDEAGLLDQDTARALLTVADECAVRVALLGDRHQLPAVGRGGVLDLAVGQVEADGYLTLEGLHRFTRVNEAGRTVPDTAYADLTLAMRAGNDPGKVFDALLARGQIRTHPDPDALRHALAGIAAAACTEGEQVAVVADTREQVAELNTAVRDRLVAAGRVDDAHATVTAAGEWIGIGDRIVTRRNSAELEVANRDTWIVADLARTGALIVTPADSRASPGRRALAADYVTQHVELGYATTAHGVQGETVTAAHLVVGESTGAASAYVGMTRGRQANTAHFVAESVDEARERWIAVFGRDRADLGPAHAAAQAAAEAARYAPARPLEQVFAELRAAWSEEQNCLDRLATGEPMCTALRQVIALDAAGAEERARLDDAWRQAAAAADAARRRAQVADAAVAAGTDRARRELWAAWNADREPAREAASTWSEGPGRLRLRRATMARAYEQLTDWADRWRPHLPDLPVEPAELAHLARSPYDPPALRAAFDAAARTHSHHAHPERAAAHAAADAARAAEDRAWRTQAEARDRRLEQTMRLGPAGLISDPPGTLANLESELAHTRERLTTARTRISALTAEPAVLAQPAERLQQENQAWRARHDAAARTAQPAVRSPRLRPPPGYHPRLEHPRGRGIAR